MAYKTRIIEAELTRALETVGAVLLEGPRGCGKTSTAQLLAKSFVKLDTNNAALELARLDPRKVLEGDTPRLIDEWQLAPDLWNHAREQSDLRQKPGQFILAGSAIPKEDPSRHPGSLRILKLRMRPMSLFESQTSTGQVSLGSLLDPELINDPGQLKQKLQGANELPLDTVIELVCRGGWPPIQSAPLSSVLPVLRSYMNDLANSDFSAVGVKVDIGRVQRVLKSLARNVGSETSNAKLAAELTEIDADLIRPETVEKYTDVLRAIMVIEDLEPWVTHLRSSHAVRKSHKRYFVDPSLAAAALGATPASLLKDLGALGFLFENLVIRDLRIYAQNLGGSVSHYRDSDGLEVDAIVTKPTGEWGAFEIKLGQNSVDQAAKSLLKFKNRVNFDLVGEPSILAVITPGEYSYLRSDGIAVIALGTLGP